MTYAVRPREVGRAAFTVVATIALLQALLGAPDRWVWLLGGIAAIAAREAGLRALRVPSGRAAEDVGTVAVAGVGALVAMSAGAWLATGGLGQPSFSSPIGEPGERWLAAAALRPAIMTAIGLGLIVAARPVARRILGPTSPGAGASAGTSCASRDETS